MGCTRGNVVCTYSKPCEECGFFEFTRQEEPKMKCDTCKHTYEECNFQQAKTFVTNFDAAQERLYRTVIKLSNLGSVAWIKDEAFDGVGRPVKSCKSLHCQSSSILTELRRFSDTAIFWRIFGYLRKVEKTLFLPEVD